MADERAALQAEDLRVDAAAVEAEDAWKVEGWVWGFLHDGLIDAFYESGSVW